MIARDAAFLLPLGVALAFGGDLRGAEKSRKS